MRLLDRLRTPRPTDLVTVTLTGHAHAVTALARALATVTDITAMNHHATTDDTIRLDATCHHPPSTQERHR